MTDEIPHRFVAVPVWLEQSISNISDYLEHLKNLNVDQMLEEIELKSKETMNSPDFKRQDVKKYRKSVLEQKKQIKDFFSKEKKHYSSELVRLKKELKNYGKIPLTEVEIAERKNEQEIWEAGRLTREKDQIRQIRKAAYASEVDPLTAELSRTKDEVARQNLENQINIAVEKIRQDNPYPAGETDA